MNLNCQKTYDQLVHFLNKELPPAEYTFWENHLAECPACQLEYEQLNDTIVALRSLPQPEPPADLVLKIRRTIEEQQETAQNMPLFDLIALIFSKITTALKLGPRPVYINYAALFCYLILAIFLIKLTFLPGGGSIPKTEERFNNPLNNPLTPFIKGEPFGKGDVNHVTTNQSDNYVAAINPILDNKSKRNDMTWAQVKMAGLRISPDLGDKNMVVSEKPPILRPVVSQVLHGGSLHGFK